MQGKLRQMPVCASARCAFGDMQGRAVTVVKEKYLCFAKAGIFVKKRIGRDTGEGRDLRFGSAAIDCRPAFFLSVLPLRQVKPSVGAPRYSLTVSATCDKKSGSPQVSISPVILFVVDKTQSSMSPKRHVTFTRRTYLVVILRPFVVLGTYAK